MLLASRHPVVCCITRESSIPGMVVTRHLDRKCRRQSLVFLLLELRFRGSCKEIDTELLSP